jgi:hypothetical protein
LFSPILRLKNCQLMIRRSAAIWNSSGEQLAITRWNLPIDGK